jgi:eukaryotic-like serine/threonine-protein kinase
MLDVIVGCELKTSRGEKIEVMSELGRGGQGRVFKVMLGANEYALKWYHRPNKVRLSHYENQREALKELIKIEPPSSEFLWPIDLVELKLIDYDGYGYLMNLRPNHFRSIEELVHGVIPHEEWGTSESGTFRSVVTVALNMANAFRQMHLKGYCYKDINMGGPFFDPRTGEVLICDNDNVRVNKTGGTVFYYEYAAPEVVRGEEIPNKFTDFHSMAVLFFYIFFRGNPFEGKRAAEIFIWDPPAKRKLFGQEPIFIFDPDDDSNRPVRGVQDAPLLNWTRFPRFIQSAFTQVFTRGLTDTHARIDDTEWVNLLSRLRDSLAVCGKCGKEYFYDRDKLRAEPNNPAQSCCWCNTANRLPPRMRLNTGGETSVVTLSQETVLYPHHFGDRYNFKAPVAVMKQHPSKPDVWGLQNLTEFLWTFTYERNGEHEGGEVLPQKSLVLRDRQTVEFNTVTSGLIKT